MRGAGGGEGRGSKGFQAVPVLLEIEHINNSPRMQAMDNWVFDNILGNPSFYHFTAWKLYEARLALQLDEHHGRSRKERWVRASIVLCALLIVLIQLLVTVCFGLALMYPVCGESADACLRASVGAHVLTFCLFGVGGRSYAWLVGV